MKSKTHNGDGDWDAYADYNKILRAWFVAFGIGVPATFLINKDLFRYLAPQKGGDPYIFIFFLIGVASQVLMAFINKIINWCAYYIRENFPNGIEENSSNGESANWWDRKANIISNASNWFLIDVFSDLITICSFVWAMVKLSRLVITTPLSSQ